MSFLTALLLFFGVSFNECWSVGSENTTSKQSSLYYELSHGIKRTSISLSQGQREQVYLFKEMLRMR